MAVVALGWYQAMHVSIHPLEWGFGVGDRVGVRRMCELPVDTIFTEVPFWWGTRHSLQNSIDRSGSHKVAECRER